MNGLTDEWIDWWMNWCNEWINGLIDWWWTNQSINEDVYSY